ncbi:MAG: hypothetical protein V7744_03070 [Pseudomonadales bacterium]
MSRFFLCTLLFLSFTVSASELLGLKSGHLKGQYLVGSYPDDSLYRELIGTPSHDLNGDLRLLIDGGKSQWSWQADYQMIYRSGDTLELSRLLAGNFAIPSDQYRLMDLTHVISDDEDSVWVHRLDRLYVGFTGEKAVVRVGRQAVSWGNGLIYNPVDFFNPFDPAAVDKEYKSGDDMVYGQYLMDSGNDWQAVSVWRRDQDGHTGNAVNTNAVKYHAFVGEQELDLLLAQHFEDDIFAVGGISSWGGAIVRGDIMLTRTDIDTYFSAVANLSYSWNWGGKNMSGIVEYFYNGFGLSEDNYDRLPQEHDLTDRLLRNELFTIGKHYLAGGITIEVSPLFNITPNAFVNLGDGSGLAQLVAQYDLKQDWLLLMALNIPWGANGTEFGGLESGVEGLRFSSGPGLFTQLAFYF